MPVRLPGFDFPEKSALYYNRLMSIVEVRSVEAAAPPRSEMPHDGGGMDCAECWTSGGNAGGTKKAP